MCKRNQERNDGKVGEMDSGAIMQVGENIPSRMI
jgi:hypothetical protein